MCVAIPSKIISKNGLLAIIEVYGARREVNLMLLPEEAEIGDYVLVHVGYAIQKISPQEARSTWEVYDQMLTAEAGSPDA